MCANVCVIHLQAIFADFIYVVFFQHSMFKYDPFLCVLITSIVVCYGPIPEHTV
jgi:hypothetical protein